MWLYPKKRNSSHSEGTWLCDLILGNEIYPILRGPDHVIILFNQKSISFWVHLTMCSYFPAKNLSHSEGTWLCDYTFQPKINFILSAPDNVIILSNQKSITFWEDLTMWLYFPAQNLSHSEGTWLNDCILRTEFYRILKGPDYVFILSSQKSIPFWGDLTMWLYFPAQNLSHSEGTWLNDCILRTEFYRILKGPDYVFKLSSQKSIPFWGDLTVIETYGMKSITFWGELTMWLYFPVKNLSHSEGNWLFDYTFQPKMYPILRGPDYVIVS